MLIMLIGVIIIKEVKESESPITHTMSSIGGMLPSHTNLNVDYGNEIQHICDIIIALL